MTTTNIIFTFLLSYLSIKLIIKYAKPLGFLDIPNDRSHHCDIVPKSAGVGFVLAFFISSAIFNYELFISYWYIYLSIALIFGIGVVDDMLDVSPKLKFIVIFIAVLFLSYFGVVIDTFGSWFGCEISLPILLAVPFTMFALAGFTNALNLIDGIDGLSGTISIIVLGVFALIGLQYDDTLIITLAFTTIVAILGFLVLNWNPAKIFMGDSGSLTLGFIISLLAVLSLEYIHPITILYLAALPILDTLIVMIRRIRRGKSPFSPDKTHIHHILVKFFEGNVPKTVLFLSILQIVFSGIGYMMTQSISQDNSSGYIPLVALFGFSLMFVIFYMIFTGIKKRQKLVDMKRKRAK